MTSVFCSQVSSPAFPTDTDIQHKFLISACQQYQSLQTFVFMWKDWLFAFDWVSMNSNPSNLNRAKLDWHLWTFNGHLACLCIFLFILLLCVCVCVCVCQMLMDTNQMYFTLSCCSYDNFGEKYCRWRGPIRMLSCTSSCICSSHQVVSCTFVCL